MSGALRRQIRALGRRIATEDPEDLEYLLVLDHELEEAMRTAITGLRHSGYSDRQIGEVLGITKQSVQERWPRSS